MATATYRAVQATKPGLLEVVEREVTAPAPGQVRIRVEACGVCHSDVLTVEGVAPGIQFPRVPGHEVVGKIDALGEGVSDWKIGQRVGVGFLGGHCGHCKPCRRGDFVNCENQPISGVASDGGYAEVMIADALALAAVPDALAPAEAAPLLCAGVTTYNALRNSPARSGDLVAVQITPTKPPTYISISNDGELFVSFATGPDTTEMHTTTLDAMAAQVAQSLGVANPTNEQVFIRADPHVKYGVFMAVVNRLQIDGYYKIGLISEEVQN